jgi:hypothetical protein
MTFFWTFAPTRVSWVTRAPIEVTTAVGREVKVEAGGDLLEVVDGGGPED